MQLSRLLFRVALLCAPVAIFGTVWLYYYPYFQHCAFPTPPSTHAQSIAPFRLLALGDPQLEGDSSLPKPNAAIFPSLESLVPELRNATTFGESRGILVEATKGVVKDAGRWLEGKRKAIDLWGNDWYLAHIVRSQVWWTEPTHISVLGDLLGSQWVTDGEFEKRAGRYWNIVMKGLEKVPSKVFGGDQDEEQEVIPDAPVEADQSGEEPQEVNHGDHEQEKRDINDEHHETNVHDFEYNSPQAVVQDAIGDSGEHAAPEVGNDGWEQLVQEIDDKNRGQESQEAEQGNRELDTSQNEPGGGDDGKETGIENEEEEKKEEEKGNEESSEKRERKTMWGGTTEVLGADEGWKKRVINIAGNHDVGYAGDLDEERVERFEKAFGSVNWGVWFTLPDELRSASTSDQSTDDLTPPALRLVILNTMNFDTPAWSSELQTETYSFMNHIINTARDVTDKTHATVLLTHIPLEKQAGVCIDSPFFDFWDGGQGVREQNMLSDHGSRIVLEGIFGLNSNKDAPGNGFGRRGLIMNGHDHEGCDVLHWIRQPGTEDSCNASNVRKEEAYWPAVEPIKVEPATRPRPTSPNHVNPFVEHISTLDDEVQSVIESPEPDLSPNWRAQRFPSLLYDIDKNDECTIISQSPRIREITLRSMMGEFAGYAGFLSAWFDSSLGERGEWVFEFSSCSVGIQHWWWGVHIVDLIVFVLFIGAGVASIVEKRVSQREEAQRYNALSNRATNGENSTRDPKQVLGITNGTSGRSIFAESQVMKRRV